jgi:hypothetical protein
VQAEKLFIALADYQLYVFRDVWAGNVGVIMDNNNLLKKDTIEKGIKYKE